MQTPGQGSHGDPFTGGSRYQAEGSETTSAQRILPVKQSLPFMQANVSAMKSKIYSLNSELADSTLQLSDDELKSIDEVFTALTVAAATKAKTADLSPSCVGVITQVAERWPPASCFPVIDLARLVCGYAPAVSSDHNLVTGLLRVLIRAAELTSPWNIPLEKHRDVNTLLLLRATANLVHSSITPSSLDWAQLVLSPLQNAPYVSLNKNQRVALATLLFNLSTVMVKNGALQREATGHMIVKVLREEKEDSEAFYRALVALGNLTYVSTTVKAGLDRDLIQSIKNVAAEAPKTFTEQRVGDVASELQVLVARL